MPQIKCNRCQLPIDREWDAFVTMPNAEQCGFRSRRRTVFAHARCFERDVKAAHDQELISREIRITAVWLRRIGDTAQVLLEMNGRETWHLVIEESVHGNFSHIAENTAIREAPTDPIQEAGRVS
jgi:hypothetical protein